MKFNNETPIYLQLFQRLALDIVTGKYSSGEKIPSVRELSVMYKVNPNTVQKALIELKDVELIYTERTNGKFVTENKKIIKECFKKFNVIGQTKNNKNNFNLYKKIVKNRTKNKALKILKERF